MRRKLSKQDLKRMRLPEAFWRAKLGDVPAKSKPTIEKYVSKIKEMHSRGIGLLILGNPGVGKTSIASVLLKESRARGYPGLFVSVWELRESVKDRIAYDDNMSFFAKCREVETLVLDDVKQIDPREIFLKESKIAELVRFRSARKKVTFITYTGSIDDFKNNLKDISSAVVGSIVSMTVVGPNLKSATHRELMKEIL